MAHIELKHYEEKIRYERTNHFATPFDMAYEAFVDLEYDKKDSRFFRENASTFVENMCSQCWAEYVPHEKEFTTRLLRMLIDREKVCDMSPVEAIEDFVMEYPMHIYKLSLSNTQSRRSRAGKEFEAILELLLIGSDVPADTQGSVGKQAFAKNGLGKLVDFVSPGVVQYLRNKRNTTLISAKTTLRERWQEVPEEVVRTGTREMYLATLDEDITEETRTVLYEANVILATTRGNKERNYADDQRIVTFEELIEIAMEAADKWNAYNYSENDFAGMKRYLQSQVNKHENHPYVKNYYQTRFNELTMATAR